MSPRIVVTRAPRRVNRWWSVAPEIGIYIGAGCVSTAVIATTASRYRLEASRVEALPDGAVVPSPVESNIRRPDLVIDRLRASVPAVGRRESAISLPDAAVRVAILDLAHVPDRRSEQEALFRHHLERLFLNPLGGCRFAFQRLRTAEGGKRERLLVAAIRLEILEEYESVVRAAGLLPSVVDLSVFHLFNLYEHTIRASLPPGRCVLFLNLFDQNFTLIMADQYGPTSIRIKAFPAALNEADLITRVLAEIDASLRAADASATEDEPPIARLCVFSNHVLGELDQLVSEKYHMELMRLLSECHPESVADAMPRNGQDGTPPNDGAAGFPPDSLEKEERQAVTMALAAAVGCRV
jgi:Type IV pilus assembly protein PilM